MEITKEEICVKVVEWIAKNKVQLYSNAVIISSNDTGTFANLIGAYNFIIDNKEK